MRHLVLTVLVAATAACPAPRSPAEVPDPRTPASDAPTGAGASAAPALRIWTVGPGVAPDTLVLEGSAMPPGTRVSVIDDRGLVGEAEIAADPAPDCDDCAADRILARADDVLLPLEGTAVAVHPLADATFGLQWHSYPDAREPGPEPRPWIELDADGDGLAETTFSVWCAEPVPSGCNDQVCSRLCRGLFDAAGTAIGEPTCESFIPDVDDCILFDGGCPRDGIGCRNIALEPFAAERVAVYVSNGVRMEFALEDVRNLCVRLNATSLRDALDAAPPGAELRLDTTAAVVPGPHVEQVLAALLEEGRARVFDPDGGAPVDYLVQEDWVWTGCGGSCRQSGRQWRLRIPGEAFFRVTDLFLDGP